MCGYAELTSSDPEVRNKHRLILGLFIATLLTIFTGLGILAYSAKTQVVQPEVEVESR